MTYVISKTLGCATPAMYNAACENNVPLVRIFAENGYAETQNHDDVYPLHGAAFHGSVDATRFLLEYGVNPNPRAYDGYTPLMLAFSMSDHYNLRHEIIRLLLSYEADPNLTDEVDETALHKSIHEAQCDGMRLVATPHNLAAQNIFGDTPLHHAAIYAAPVSCIRFLINHNNHVNTREKIFGTTPLYCAVDTQHINGMICMLNAGADANTHNKNGTSAYEIAQNGTSAYEIAQKHNNETAMNMLLQYGAIPPRGYPMLCMFAAHPDRWYPMLSPTYRALAIRTAIGKKSYSTAQEHINMLPFRYLEVGNIILHCHVMQYHNGHKTESLRNIQDMLEQRETRDWCAYQTIQHMQNEIRESTIPNWIVNDILERYRGYVCDYHNPYDNETLMHDIARSPDLIDICSTLEHLSIWIPQSKNSNGHTPIDIATHHNNTAFTSHWRDTYKPLQQQQNLSELRHKNALTDISIILHDT